MANFKRASEILLGDMILVDLGMGKVEKIVDNVRQKGEIVEIVLYSTFGKRPKLTVNSNSLIETPEVKNAD